MRQDRFKSKLFFSLAIVLALSGIIALVLNTFAYFRGESKAENFLQSKTLKVDLIDKFDNNQLLLPGDSVNKDVYMYNSGQVNAVVRIKLTPAWDIEGTDPQPDLDTSKLDIIYGPNLESNWDKVGDWYYYKKILSPEETTTLLVDRIKLKPVSNDSHVLDYSGASYTLDVQSQSLQANPVATLDNWEIKYEINPDGTLNWGGSEG